MERNENSLVKDTTFFREPYMAQTLASSGRGYPMMIYQEKRAPPLAPLSDDELAALVEKLVGENIWIESFIARLNDTIRDMKHRPN